MTGKSSISKIRKRDGRIVEFEPVKITNAIHKAFIAVKERDGETAKNLSAQVVAIIEDTFKDRIPTVEEVQDIVEKVLIKNGFTFEVLNYPTSYRERSIDIVAVKDDKKFLIRIRLSIKNINKEEANDLIKAASAIDAIPIIINNEETYENVVYEKEGIYIMGDRTFNNILKGSSEVFILYKKGDFFIKINPKKLEQLRIALGLSLGELALRVGVSRRMIFDYERGISNVTLEVAERLVEVLGEDIIEPITIESLKSNMMKGSSDSDNECINLLDIMGLDSSDTAIYRISSRAHLRHDGRPGHQERKIGVLMLTGRLR